MRGIASPSKGLITKGSRTRILAAGAATALGTALLIAAPAPSFAAATPATITANCTAGQEFGVSATTVVGQVGDTFAVALTGDTGTEIQVQVSVGGGPVSPEGGTTIPVGNQATFTIAAAGPFLVNLNSGGCLSSTPSYTIVVSIGSGGGDSSVSAAPRTETLSINTEASGATCANSGVSGDFGTWITLPAANDCTPPPSKPGATLLGWATSPDFPVEIAQRQVSNGWGAYETFNADGQLTGVFIPAGGATFLSGSGNLFPIWS